MQLTIEALMPLAKYSQPVVSLRTHLLMMDAPHGMMGIRFLVK